MFGNVPQALWSRWIEPDERNRIPLACRALLVEDLDGRTVLLEAGIGAFFDPKLKDRFGVLESGHILLESLAKRGLTDADIDIVILSHLHFDHAGGLLSAWKDGEDPQLLFPNAEFLVGSDHWQRAQDPHSRDRASFIPDLNRQLLESGRLHLVSGPRHELTGNAVRYEYSSGHTPGLMLAEVSGAEESIVFCADLIPGTPWVHLPVTMGYDRYPELLIDEKQAFLNDKLERDAWLFFTHDVTTAAAKVQRDDRGRYVTHDERDELDGVIIR